MDELKRQLREQLGPLYEWLWAVYYITLEPLIDPKGRLFWVYDIAALLVALLVLAYWRRREALGGGLLRRLFPREVYLHRSARLDYGFYFIGRALELLPGLGLKLLSTVGVSLTVAAALTALLGPGGFASFDAAPLRLAFTIAIFLAADFAYFLAHWLQHRVPLLWEFHKVHHAAEVLTPITNYRQHFVDFLVQGQITALLAGVVAGLFLWAAGREVLPYTVLSIGVIDFVYNLTAHLRHSHVWLDYGPRLSRVLSSPAMHQIHHSREPHHWDRNYGLVLSVWDELFGTNYVPRGRERFRFGLADGSHVEFDSVLKLYYLPFVKLAQRLVRRTAPGG